MASFRIHAESDLILQSCNYRLLGLVVLEHVPQSVPLAYHRKDSKEIHDSGNQRPVEHVRPCSKDSRASEGAKYDKGIHQRVAVVRSDQYGSVTRDVLLAPYLHLPIAVLQIAVNDGFEEGVSKILVVNVLSHSSLRLLPFFRGFSTHMQE